MQFNPLFIQPVSTTDPSVKTSTSFVQKQMNLNNSSYLFSDIIRIVNENLPDEQQTALSDVNDNTPSYLSIDDNFKYRMFITLAESAQSKDNNLTANLNGSDVQFPVSFFTTASSKPISGTSPENKAANLQDITSKSVDGTGIESIINQLSALFAKLGIKPKSIELNKSVTTQVTPSDIKNLFQKIDQAISSNKSNDQNTTNSEDKKSTKNSEAALNISNLLSGMLQSNNSIHLELTANGNSVKLEIASTVADAANRSGNGKIITSVSEIDKNADISNNSNLFFPVIKDKTESKNSTSAGQVKNKIIEVLPSGNSSKLAEIPDASVVTKNSPSSLKVTYNQDSNSELITKSIPNKISSEEAGIEGVNYPDLQSVDLNAKDLVNSETTNKTQTKLQDNKFSNRTDISSSNTKNQLNEHLSTETLKDIQTTGTTKNYSRPDEFINSVPKAAKDGSVQSFSSLKTQMNMPPFAETDKNIPISEINKNNTKSTANKFFISVSRTAKDDQVKDTYSTNNNIQNLKKFIAENPNSDIKFKLEIKNPNQQNSVNAPDQKKEIENLSFKNKSAADILNPDSSLNTSKSESFEQSKQIFLNLNHSNETINESKDANSKSETINITELTSESRKVSEFNKNQSGSSFNNTDNKASDNSSKENQGTQVKKADLSFSVLNQNSTAEMPNSVREMVINDKLPNNELPKTYKLSEAINEIKSLMTKGDTKSAVLQLAPESLGKVKVTLDVTSNSVHAHIEVDNETVKQAVQNNVNDLKQSLNQNGMQLNSFTVNLSGGEQRQNKFFNLKKKLNYQNIKVQEEDNQESYSTKSLGYNTYEYLA